MRVFLHNEESTLLTEAPSSLLFEHSGQLISHKIEQVRRVAKHQVISVSGIHTREQAENMKGAKILAPRNLLPETQPDEFYVADLVGMEAFDNGELLGKISKSRALGEIEVATIVSEEFEVEVPLVHAYVMDIDFKSKRILLRETESLPRTKLKRGPKGKPRV